MPVLSSERWVATGLLWAAIAGPLTILLGWGQGEIWTAEQVALHAGAWAAAGLGFGQAMRAVARRGSPHAR